MSVSWYALNHRDRTTLSLGTGRWDYVFGWECNPLLAPEIANRLKLHFESWGEERLFVWAMQIATLMNGAPISLGNDTDDPTDDERTYRSLGVLPRGKTLRTP